MESTPSPEDSSQANLPTQDSALVPPNAPECSQCDSPVMIPWAGWWECPRCDGVRLPDVEHQIPLDE